ncbi:MAG: type II secretion system protein [Candidatus Zambryskibacteria bacterium]|nr:type II secretion system protein [Candidatus Zambryskibacteria bacterium]
MEAPGCSISKSVDHQYMKYKKGVTIAELVISISILGVLAYTVSIFQRDIFSLNFSAQNSLSAQLDARHVLKQLVAELREASPSSLGGYPIALASSTALTFYSDINNDGIKERIRYFMSGTTLRRGELSPTGSPLVYVDANEKLSSAVAYVSNNATTSIFTYYPSTFAGTTSPLTQPVTISSIRMIGINILIEKDPNRSPSPLRVTTSVVLRNLKDNL